MTAQNGTNVLVSTDWVSQHLTDPSIRIAEVDVDTAAYVPSLDGIVHTKSGVDDSTDRPSSVAMALAFAGKSSAHQVGGDATEASSPVYMVNLCLS